ncbi:hypothetical protein KM043_011410 [Ampulex compressa]|nr:hypothetical protein KM043_011410 [Ampulex compressa]
MRDTSDMMEDALSEDTIMDYRGDSGSLEGLVNLGTSVADSSPTIRDAAERLLTLLGVDEDNEEFSSSSEDEGVEVDVDEFEEDEEEQENVRLLQQLAASLAQELKYSQQKQTTATTRVTQGSRSSFETIRDRQVESMDTMQEANYFEHDYVSSQADTTLTNRSTGDSTNESNHQQQGAFDRSKSTFGNLYQSHQECATRSSKDFEPFDFLDHRLRMDTLEESLEGRYSNHQDYVPGSWAAGWDACATEALRYLVEDEGLPAHHPTVVAMKNHLDSQRERAFAQYTACEETGKDTGGQNTKYCFGGVRDSHQARQISVQIQSHGVNSQKRSNRHATSLKRIPSAALSAACLGDLYATGASGVGS